MDHLKLRFIATEDCRIEIHFEESVDRLSMSVEETQRFLAVLKEVERCAYDALQRVGTKPEPRGQA